MASILTTVKTNLGIAESDTTFDPELIIFINSTFLALNQINVGTTEVFKIVGNDEEWEDFFGTATNLEAVKTYIFIKVRLLFDPPQNSYAIESFNKLASEIEWRLCAQGEVIE